jgi:TfoX/Sxy family transcriptional regulator of competence genes
LKEKPRLLTLSRLCFIGSDDLFAFKHRGRPMAFDEATAERVRNLLRRRDLVERKMMGGLCFMVDGAMCCAVSGKGGLLVRVDPSARERMLAEPDVSPADMRGRRMTGFVRVAPEGYRTDAALKTWIERGIAGIAAEGARKKPRPKKRT